MPSASPACLSPSTRTRRKVDRGAANEKIRGAWHSLLRRGVAGGARSQQNDWHGAKVVRYPERYPCATVGVSSTPACCGALTALGRARPRSSPSGAREGVPPCLAGPRGLVLCLP